VIRGEGGRSGHAVLRDGPARLSSRSATAHRPGDSSPGTRFLGQLDREARGLPRAQDLGPAELLYLARPHETLSPMRRRRRTGRGSNVRHCPRRRIQRPSENEIWSFVDDEVATVLDELDRQLGRVGCDAAEAARPDHSIAETVKKQRPALEPHSPVAPGEDLREVHDVEGSIEERARLRPVCNAWTQSCTTSGVIAATGAQPHCGSRYVFT
jgi:hypothetical protein